MLPTSVTKATSVLLPEVEAAASEVASVVVLVAFSLCLLITRNLAVSCVVMAVAAFATFIVLTFPLAMFETPKSKRWNFGSIVELFKQCFPLFIALFLYAFIDNMPKFVMEGVLSYDNQLYFNALYFPAQGILLTVGFIYKPLLVRMANVWADPTKRKRFDLIIVVIMAVIVAVAGVTTLAMAWIGIPVIELFYTAWTSSSSADCATSCWPQAA